VEVEVRDATADHAGFLAAMLAVAFDWRPGTVPRPVAELPGLDGVWHYVDGWPRTGDAGVVAVSGVPVGAAWWRHFRGGDPGFGFVDEGIPEIAVGVVGRFRGRGVGATLLGELIARAVDAGLPGLSLSVEPDNPALRLYRRLGFVEAGGVDGSLTMLLGLGG